MLEFLQKCHTGYLVKCIVILISRRDVRFEDSMCCSGTKTYVSLIFIVTNQYLFDIKHESRVVQLRIDKFLISYSYHKNNSSAGNSSSSFFSQLYYFRTTKLFFTPSEDNILDNLRHMRVILYKFYFCLTIRMGGF